MLQWFDTLLGLVVILLAASLFVMILTQAVVVLLNLRGQNLAKSVRTLLAQSDDSLGQYAARITEAALSHPLVTDASAKVGRLNLATTIRSKELENVLERLANPEGEEWQKALYRSIRKVKTTLSDWFDAVMDRATERFIKSTRAWTIGFSVIVALLLHLDAIEIFARISSDAGLRARLVAATDAMLEQTPVYLGSANRVPAIYADAMAGLAQDDPTLAGLELPASGFTSRGNAVRWLQEQAAARPDVDSVVARYERLLDAGLTRSVDQLRDQAASLSATLTEAEFRLVPDPYPGWDYSLREMHLWGVLLMASLMSLGAPFWFNVLRGMSTLRPILAGKEHQERKQRASQTGTAQT